MAEKKSLSGCFPGVPSMVQKVRLWLELTESLWVQVHTHSTSTNSKW